MPVLVEKDIKFSNDAQESAYFATERNELFSGSFNNGKSYGFCLKVSTLLTTFDKYRAVIARQTRADLMKTTYQTFFKIMPRQMIAAQNMQDGVTYLKNGSRIDWLHLDGVEESTLRGLEINAVFTDQAEEVDEKVYDILDSRIGRWDEAIVPQSLLGKYPNWPINDFTGKYVVPSYHMNACNPDTQFHHLYRHYHPDSIDRIPNHFFVESQWDTKLGSKESYEKALRNGEEWVQKYIYGLWGISKAQIHRVTQDVILEADQCDELLDRIKRRGSLFRVLDHGDAAPTCCLWWAAIDGVYICYREYYSPGRVISQHRQAIHDLSNGERYRGNYADPAIFKKQHQKEGNFWTTADEYITNSIEGPPLTWIAADNNEFATRNRINELLRSNTSRKHPITGLYGAPGIYFIKRSVDFPSGCEHAIKELGSQRRKLLGYYEGEALYADDREENVADHAYDCTRYFVAMHGSPLKDQQKIVPRNSLKYYEMLRKRTGGKLKGPMSGRYTNSNR